MRLICICREVRRPARVQDERKFTQLALTIRVIAHSIFSSPGDEARSGMLSICPRIALDLS
jgi:hypothetical protein